MVQGRSPVYRTMIWPMPPPPPLTGSHFVVCGDNPLAYRIARELTRRYGEDVVVILADKLKNHGPQIADLPASPSASTPG